MLSLDRLGSTGKHFPYGEARGTGTGLFATYLRDDASGLDYAVNRYYSSGLGRFMSADPYRRSARIRDPRSWNRYAYVGGDPVNAIDPVGLCTAMLAGITMNPFDSKPFDDLQISLGAVAGFPYSGLSATDSIGNIAAQALWGGNASTEVALLALRNAMAGTSGAIDVVAYSGGAQAFTTAFGMLSPSEQARIGSILYISPGAVGTLATTTDPSRTSVVMGTGPADVGATLSTTIPVGVDTTWTGCSHTDLACLLKAAARQISRLQSNGPCAYQNIFSLPIDPLPVVTAGAGPPQVYDPGVSSSFGWMYWTSQWDLVGGGGGYAFDYQITYDM